MPFPVEAPEAARAAQDGTAPAGERATWLALLDRRVDLHFDAVPLREALAQVEAAGGVRVRVDASCPRAVLRRTPALHARALTVGEALERALAQAAPDGEASWDVRDDGVVVGAWTELRTYAVGPRDPVRLAAFVRAHVAPGCWEDEGLLAVHRGRLVVVATPGVQRAVAGLLERVTGHTAPAPPAAFARSYDLRGLAASDEGLVERVAGKLWADLACGEVEVRHDTLDVTGTAEVHRAIERMLGTGAVDPLGLPLAVLDDVTGGLDDAAEPRMEIDTLLTVLERVAPAAEMQSKNRVLVVTAWSEEHRAIENSLAQLRAPAAAPGPPLDRPGRLGDQSANGFARK